jgi:hypothetical protein
LPGARRAAERIQNDVRTAAEALRLLGEGERQLQRGPQIGVPN